MQANRKKVTLQSGREVTIKALGMLTLRNLRGTLPIAARDGMEADAQAVSDAAEDDAKIDSAIELVIAGCAEPNFVNTLTPENGSVSIDDLSVGEFVELGALINDFSGLTKGVEAVAPLSRAGKA